MSVFLLALGLVMIIEGLAYALAPSLIERMLEMLRSLPESAVRQMGWLVVVSGAIMVWTALQIGSF